MSGSIEFLLYVTVYRLSVLAVGAFSIYLGFRLLNRPAELARSGVGTASAEVESKLFTLRLSDFWPGAYFALFGTILIGIMLWQGPPEMKTEVVKEQTDVGLKSTNTVDIRGTIAVDPEWVKLDKPGMISAEAAEPLSNIARIWQQEGRIGEAVAMARLAALYGKGEKRADYLHRLADLLSANGDKEKAAETLRAAEAMQEGR